MDYKLQFMPKALKVFGKLNSNIRDRLKKIIKSSFKKSKNRKTPPTRRLSRAL
jgi:mRNA-degrading endonuclease RelE of RelBE toxin-antitoxin system